MNEPQLQKSKNFIEQNFDGLHPLGVQAHPLSFQIETLEEDMIRIESDLTGLFANKKGEKIAVITERDTNFNNFIYVEFLDLETAGRLGHVTFLFQPQKNEFSIGYFNLTSIQKRGFGRKITEIFRSFIPEGAKINCVIEEESTNRLLKRITQDLMEKGEITDWMIDSPLRPQPKKGEKIPLPLRDQKKIESHFLPISSQVKTPIFALMESFQGRFESLCACLCDNGRFAFLLTYTHHKKIEKIKDAP